MELFSVICTTCQSKLKVRDRAIIGQIVACPKCQGMVMVAPPEGWIDAGPTPAVSAPAPAAPTMPAASGSFASASSSAPVVKPAKPASASSGTFEDAASLFERPAADTTAPPVAALPGEASAPLPNGEWISPQTQAMRRWVLIGGLSTISAVVLISALVYAFSGGEESVAVVPPANVETPGTSEEPEPQVEEPAPKEPVDAPAEPKKKATPVEPIEKPADPNPAQPPKEKPLPEATTDAPPDPAVEPVKPEPESAKPDDAPKPLNIFGDLIEEKPFEVQPSGEPAQPMPMPLAPMTDPAAPIADEEPLPRPAPRKIDIARRLADPIDAIEMSDMPLADFLQLVIDMTALPITLDPTALPAIKASPESKISVNLKATKVGDLLTAALAPHNLGYIATDTQVMVLPMASVKGELRQIKHELGDLAKTEAEATVLAEAIHACIDPTSWDDVGGRGTLKVDGTTLIVTQSPEAHFAIVVLCEKLRLARKLPTRSNYPAEVVSLTPKAIAADAMLDTPVTVNFVPPTRLGRVAEHLKRTTGLRMIVDYHALAEAGWTPEGEVKAGVAGQPLSAFLDRLSRRMEVAWRVVDGQTVQLTTPAALIANADVEVYPIVAGDSAALLDRLQNELGSELFAPGGGGALRYDSVGQTLIARLPQASQRQLMELLAKAAM